MVKVLLTPAQGNLPCHSYINATRITRLTVARAFFALLDYVTFRPGFGKNRIVNPLFLLAFCV